MVKSSSSIAEEVFATKLLHFLLETSSSPFFFRAKVPGVRVVEYTDPEWTLIKKTLKRLSRDENSEEALRVNHKLNSELDRAFYLIFEFIPHSQTLEGIDPALASSILTQPAVLEALGAIMAIDCLINNMDRIPAVHDNEGNARNIMFGPLTGATYDLFVYAIDTGITSLNSFDAFTRLRLEKYQERVRALLKSAFGYEENKDAEQEAVGMLQSTRVFIFAESASDIGVEGCKHLLRGLKAMSIQIASLNLSDLEELKERVAALVRVDWEHVWEKSVDLIRIDFLDGMLSLFKGVVAEFTKVHKDYCLQIEEPSPVRISKENGL